jgi:hypothetical protein
MTIRTFDIVNGTPVPAVGDLNGPAALARKREIEGRLSAIKGDASKLDEREALNREIVVCFSADSVTDLEQAASEL